MGACRFFLLYKLFEGQIVLAREMRPRELLKSFVFFLLSGKLLELHGDPSDLDVVLSNLGLSVSGECQMGEVLAEGTDAQVSKKSTQHSGVYNDNDVPCSWNVRYLYYF